MNSRQARNNHRSDHWSAPLFYVFIACREFLHCACAIKSKQTVIFAFVCQFMLYAQKASNKYYTMFGFYYNLSLASIITIPQKLAKKGYTLIDLEIFIFLQYMNRVIRISYWLLISIKSVTPRTKMVILGKVTLFI